MSNTAVAVQPDVTYVVATDGDRVAGRRRAAAGRGPRRRLVGDGDRFAGADMERWTYQRPFELVDWPESADGSANGHYVVLADYVTTDDGTGLVHQAPAFGAEDLAGRRGLRAAGGQAGAAGRPLRGRRPAGRRRVLQARRQDARARPRGARPAVPAPRLRALLPALLALPHGAALLRPAVVVHPHDPGQGRAAGRERAHQLVPRDHQVGPLRRLAEQQHRLGAVALPLLGHSAADLAATTRTPSTWCASGRWPSSVELAGRGPVRPRPAPPVRRRRHVHAARSAPARSAGCPR